MLYYLLLTCFTNSEYYSELCGDSKLVSHTLHTYFSFPPLFLFCHVLTDWCDKALTLTHTCMHTSCQHLQLYAALTAVCRSHSCMQISRLYMQVSDTDAQAYAGLASTSKLKTQGRLFGSC